MVIACRFISFVVTRSVQLRIVSFENCPTHPCEGCESQIPSGGKAIEASTKEASPRFMCRFSATYELSNALMIWYPNTNSSVQGEIVIRIHVQTRLDTSRSHRTTTLTFGKVGGRSPLGRDTQVESHLPLAESEQQ
jgi:hypothetical protein